MPDRGDSDVAASEGNELGERLEVSNSQDGAKPTKQRIVKLLAPAVRLWLKTQVDAVEDLQVDIQSGDRALLSGKIDQVMLAARGVIYQGVHLSCVQVSAQNIQVNLGQILRGKPLKLLAPIPISGSAQIQARDLNASTEADLLANALTEFLSTFLQVGLAKTATAPLRFQSPQIHLGDGHVILNGILTDGQQQQIIGIQTQVTLANPHTLCFQQLAWQPDVPMSDRNPATWDDLKIDLGRDVAFQTLSLVPGEIRCQVQLTIQP